LGRIDVFPDHPHEGQVKVPENLGLACRDGSPEYPPATSGSGQVRPEIIARGRVAGGNTASSLNGPGNKIPTRTHTFDVLAAYDGHRANVGRVVTDSTWHHFVNVKLIGIFEGGRFDDFGRQARTSATHGIPGKRSRQGPSGQDPALLREHRGVASHTGWDPSDEQRPVVGCDLGRPHR
jgi:hypothetical protein